MKAAVFLLVTAALWPSPASGQHRPGDVIRADLQTIDGRITSVEELRGRVVLLDFWATWCAPCLADLPKLKKLHAQYSRDDFEIIGISLDTMDRRTFNSWVRRNSIAWPQVQEGRGYNGDLARLFGVEQLPVTILLGRDGRVARRDLRGAELESAIAAEIAKSPNFYSPRYSAIEFGVSHTRTATTLTPDSRALSKISRAIRSTVGLLSKM